MTRLSSTLAFVGIACLLATTAMARPDAPTYKQPITTSMGTPEVCRFPFFYDNKWFYTCIATDIEPGNPGKPWCVLKDEYVPAKPANNWLYCDMSKFQSAGILSDGHRYSCLPQTLPNITYTGCIGDTEKGPSSCKTDNDGTVVTGSCLTIRSQLDLGGDNTAKTGLAISVGANDANSDDDSTKKGSNNVVISLAAVLSVAGVGLLAGLFIYRRRQSRQNLSWRQQNKDEGQMESSAAGPGFAAMAAVGATGYRESASSSNIFSPVSPGERMYPVISTYTPTLGDELEIQPGDKVSILIEYDDGWCQGVNHTRGGLKGVFPRHCVDMTAGMPVDDADKTVNSSTATIAV